jgi:hypothetical protein
MGIDLGTSPLAPVLVFVFVVFPTPESEDREVDRIGQRSANASTQETLERVGSSQRAGRTPGLQRNLAWSG